MNNKFLMIAYACDPDGDGEHWLGWGWVELAARDHEVWLIAPPKAKTAILRETKRLGNVHPVFVELSDEIRRISERLGGLGVWMRKWHWQSLARGMAKRLHAEHKFNLVQQTTFHTFRIPFAGRGLGIPSIWGPLAGGESIPLGFESYLPSTARSEKFRDFLNRLTLRLPSIRESLDQADVLLVSNSTNVTFFGKRYQSKCVIVPANAVRDDELGNLPPPAPHRDEKVLLHVGNCVERRGMPLVFEALKDFPAEELRLIIAGAGPALKTWQELAAQICPALQVEFLGRIPRVQVTELYDQTDVFLFPSLRDSGGSGLLEAMTRAIPVICLDHGGPAEMLDEGAGIRIPVTNPGKTVVALRDSIKGLLYHPEMASEIGRRGRERAIHRFTWDGKAASMRNVYNSLKKA
jgi:glycosyltransferase involved in cell wall biosynthesis